MNIKVDTHSHTLVSGHAYNTIQEMAKMAKEQYGGDCIYGACTGDAGNLRNILF